MANSRGGREANLAALRSLNHSIALAPANLDANVRARLYGYRGADLKRLGRFDEAEQDLLFARRLAQAPYETQDIRYNLACVYALTHRKEAMLRDAKGTAGSGRGSGLAGGPAEQAALFRELLGRPRLQAACSSRSFEPVVCSSRGRLTLNTGESVPSSISGSVNIKGSGIAVQVLS